MGDILGVRGFDKVRNGFCGLSEVYLSILKKLLISLRYTAKVLERRVCVTMPLVFLFYLLCAITDCPPPVLHNTNSGNPLRRIFSISQKHVSISPSESRYARSNLKDEPEFPIALSKYGIIQGRYMKSKRGRKIAAFEGIPYSLPPIGNLRFRNPVPITSFGSKVFVANHTRKDCLQLDFSRLMQVRGEEDCLYLNIYCPDIFSQNKLKQRTKSPLPVLVFLHGGGWMSHTSTLYGPRYLLEKDIILITFNFRLGILGFLSTGDHHAQGNFGLKDQTLALKWVKDNIRHFGGDPKKITLIGESTGAGSAALHILSPLSSKLIPIQGVIALSGGSLNHWAILNDTFENTRAVAKRMGCPTKDSADLVNCLRQQNPYMVVGQQMHLWTLPLISRLLFGPVLESTMNNPEAFITEDPKVTYEYKRDTIQHVPVIAGMNRDEGSLFAANAYLVPFMFSAINSDWNKMASYVMAYDRLSGINIEETSAKISKFYFNGKRWSYRTRDKISEALGDRTIATGVYKFLESHSQVAPTYGYFLTEKSSFSILRQLGLRREEWPGVSHGDELPLIFSMDQYFDELQDPRDIQLSEFLVNICVNFANDRQPMPENVVSKNVTWKPILTPKYMQVLEINAKKRMIPFPYTERMKFWEKLNLM